jgi:UDP-GlcNAc:undecaprenyl-phosphate GlcNAc-1-phosphate transferase
VREYALVFLVAAAATYLLTPLVRRFAVRVGAMTEPRDRDVHAIPTPRLGGIAMYGGVVIAMVVAQSLPALRAGLRDSVEIKAVLIGGGVITLLGAVDDKWGLDALTKLTGQVFATGLMVLFGVVLSIVILPWSHGEILILGPEAVPLTIILAVTMVNSINFIDGLDGLAAGVVAIAAVAFFAYSYQYAHLHGALAAEPASLISAILAGVCVGFLPHNFNPARIFMGDSGSMLLGLMLAAATTSGTGKPKLYQASTPELAALFFPLLIPVLVLAVPFVDLLLAIGRRAIARKPLFAPDKQHLHHRLLEIGHSHRRAVLILYLWSALAAFGGVAVSFTRPKLVGVVVGSIAILALLMSNFPKLRAGSNR